MRIWNLSLFLFLITPAGWAQPALRKLSPALQQRIKVLPPAEDRIFWIVASQPDSVKKLFKEVTEYPGGLLVVQSNWRFIDSLQAASALVRFVDIPRRPIEELALSAFNNSLNNLNQVQHIYPALTGNSMTVSVKENQPDSSDIDFKGRWLTTPLASPTISQHATYMATIIAGGGNSFHTGKGAAPGARISSSDFATLLPDPDPIYRQYGISIQNHSYGTGIENYYGADAAAYDASTSNNPHLLHVFSAGNSGTTTGAGGPFAGVPNMANITGSFKMAKNIITVAATDSFGQVSLVSSKGPAYDGRVKPELVAFGQDGSSGAAALTSGAALLLQQAYKEHHNGNLPEAALVKALLINSADDTGAPGPDFISGYGSLNAFKALQTLLAGHYLEGDVAQGAEAVFALPVGTGVRRLTITLCWTDPAAAPNAPQALLNDLGLELVNGANTWQPWILHTQAVLDSLMLPAVRGKDSLNTVEQITIDRPAAGAYTIRVKGAALANDSSQHFFIAWQQDTANRFEWQYPLSGDQLNGGSHNIIRWSSTYDAGQGLLQYSPDKGATWQTIRQAAPLAGRQFYWPAPDTFSTALLRMTIDGQAFTSDTFTISSPLPLQVGFNCTDSVMLYWRPVPGISGYTVYRLGDIYLQPLTTTTDSSIVIHHSMVNWYTIAPLIDGNKQGLKAYTIDLTAQGMGCFLKNFLADLVNENKARLFIEIGVARHVKSITAEKLVKGAWHPLQVIQPVTGLQLQVMDEALHHGANTYRVKIVLENGAVVYSGPQTVYYFLNSSYLVFPNPARAGGSLQVVMQNVDETQLIMYNAFGQKVLEYRLFSSTKTVPLNGLQSGIYFIQILKNGKKDFTGRLIVQ